MSKAIKVKAFVVDTTHLRLYLEDGSINSDIKQGDPRLATVVAKATPQIKANGFALIELEDLKEENAFSDYEKKSNGFVRLFKVAKAKLKEIFAPTIESQVVGDIPKEGVEEQALTCAIEQEKEIKQSMKAIAEVIKHATPVSDPKFNTKDIYKQGKVAEDGRTDNTTADSEESHTIIAVVDSKEGKRVIPEMERIESQFKHAAKNGSNPIGMQRFLERLGSVIEKRQHSVQDVLKFIERNDMPIADDGCFIAYKVLNDRGDHFVDVHSGNVTQWLGSYVHMDESMVDQNRRNQCSHGLHIARRGYVGGFTGSVCVLAKVAPEDVIAVPTYDANKIRVCGYHIVEKLSDAEFSAVKTNKAITSDDAGGRKLAKIIAGQHVHRSSSVKIGGPKGTQLTVVRNLEKTVSDIPEHRDDRPVVVEALPDSNDVKLSAKPVNPKDVLVEETKVVEAIATSRKERAKQLYDAWMSQPTKENLDALKGFKKASKSSWDKLGITDPDSKNLPVPKVTPPMPPVKAPKAEVKHKVEPKGKEKPVKPSFVDSSSGSPRERINKMLAIGINAQTAPQMYDIKKKAKKSWADLGVSDGQAKRVQEYLK